MARIELSKHAFFHNLAYLSDKLTSKKKLAIVLKDNAYGHGLEPMAALASEFGLTRAVVRTFEEARSIASYFDHILILNPRNPFTPDPKFTLTVNTLDDLTKLPPKSRIELKVDTGMHRNGIRADALSQAFDLLMRYGHTLAGVMTHFRSADELGSDLFWQLQNWQNIKSRVQQLCTQHCLPTPLFHSANSATLLRLKSYEDDFARCGIAAYGYHEMDAVFGAFDLKPVMQLYAEKIATTTLRQGERIGYGGMFAATEEMTVSTYDIGYGDGFLRFDGKGEYRINGKKVLGRISMDSLSLEGSQEEVALIGDAKEIARSFGTISYDVLVKLNPQIPRIIVD